MPIGKYLERRDFQVCAIAGFFIVLLLMHQYGAFIAYGIPGVIFHEVNQTKPDSRFIVILSASGSWVSYEYYGEAYGEWKNLLGQRIYVKVSLSATLKIKVETSDLMLGEFLTEIKPPPFLINETETQIIYENMTVQAYSYGFKITTAWSGSVQVSVLEEHRDPIIIGGPSFEDLTKQCVRDVLVPDFNKYYLTAAKILLSIDAPTLGKDKSYELRPDYLGIAGMWLADYQVAGYTTGTAAEMIPQSKGTAVTLYRDKALTDPCWSPDYSYTGKPTLTPSVVYWLDHFAPACAWWSISIVNIGSQLVYDETKAHPNYVSWAWEKYGTDKTAPAVAQWFRVDLLFRTTKGWTVPKIPEYELPEEEKQKMRIIVTVEPENQGTPINPPSVTGAIPWVEIMYLMLIFFGGLIVVIIVYYVSKTKLGVKRT